MLLFRHKDSSGSVKGCFATIHLFFRGRLFFIDLKILVLSSKLKIKNPMLSLRNIGNNPSLGITITLIPKNAQWRSRCAKSATPCVSQLSRRGWIEILVG